MGHWKSSSLGCDRKGDEIGATVSCAVQSLANGIPDEFRLMSYRTVDGVWVGARYSNVAAGTTN